MGGFAAKPTKDIKGMRVNRTGFEKSDLGEGPAKKKTDWGGQLGTRRKGTVQEKRETGDASSIGRARVSITGKTKKEGTLTQRGCQ